MPSRPVALALAICTSTTLAGAQCGGWDTRFGIVPGLQDEALAIGMADPDGAGPMGPQPVIGGRFRLVNGLEADRIAYWDGQHWRPLGSGVGGAVRGITSWDPDGAGPQSPQIVVTGEFLSAGGASASQVAAWDGQQWNSMGFGIDAPGRAVVSWDADGDGPLSPVVVVGGEFQTAGSGLASRVAKWDGVMWHPMGPGLGWTVHALAIVESDGPGSAQRLFAAGAFTSSGTTAIDRVAEWTGGAWVPVGAGIDAPVRSRAAWDPDGPGGAPVGLVAAGEFTAAGPGPAAGVAFWDGTEWLPLGTGLNNTVFAVRTWDDDRSPSTPDALLVGGAFTASGTQPVSRIARWEGGSWVPLLGGLDSDVFALLPVEAPPTSLATTALLVAGKFMLAGGQTSPRLAAWDGVAWIPSGGAEVRTSVYALLTWDPDQGGPAPTELVVGGGFQGLAGNDGVAAYSQESGWRALGSGLPNGNVGGLLEWDLDGAGPALPQLVACGSFNIPSPFSRGIAAWDGQRWIGLGTGASSVAGVTLWDPDGDGPTEPKLIAGGPFQSISGVAANRVAMWEFPFWQPLGTGLNGGVNAVLAWDPDDDGPMNQVLVAAGKFQSAGGVSASNIAFWDGNYWAPLGEGLGGIVQALVAFDEDGDGPEAPRLIAGGSINSSGTTPMSGVARWDGTAWHPMGEGLGGEGVDALHVWDPDGDGPMAATLVAGGLFTISGSNATPRLARWDGKSWQPIGGGLSSGGANALATWDRDGDGPAVAELVVGGWFRSIAGDIPTVGLAMWSINPPEITMDPADQFANPGQTVFLSVGAAAGAPEFQWRRNGVELADGPTGTGSTLLGTRGTTLRVSNAQLDDSGEYDCVVSNSCGTAASQTATLLVGLPCAPDITSNAVSGSPGYLVPNGVLNNDDFFAYLLEFAAGNLAIADLTTGAVPGQPGYGMPNGVLNSDDFFFYLSLFAAGC
ncbi:MAG: immunoglobulin domain-containing protein [Phycisphaerales bacterium]